MKHLPPSGHQLFQAQVQAKAASLPFVCSLSGRLTVTPEVGAEGTFEAKQPRERRLARHFHPNIQQEYMGFKVFSTSNQRTGLQVIHVEYHLLYFTS